MKNKHIPIRKCAGCGDRKCKQDFVRIVYSKEKNEVLIDDSYKMNCRGVYLCRKIECLKKCRKSRRLERTFLCKVKDEFYGKLEEMFLKGE